MRQSDLPGVGRRSSKPMHLHKHCENVALAPAYVNARAYAERMQSVVLVPPGIGFDVLVG